MTQVLEQNVIAAAVDQLLPLMAHAVGVFGNEQKALHWMSTPLPLFDMQAPSEILRGPGGVDRVETVLTRIEHNIPS